MNKNKAAENLVGVIKSIVREELQNQEDQQQRIGLTRKGAKWTEEEEEQLVKEFYLAVAIFSLLHQRSEAGIFARLAELQGEGKLRYQKF